MELLQAGDVDRALVEFRNVFELNAQHRDARLAYAGAVLEQGRVREAFGHYLWLVEQTPDDVDSRLALAELAVLGQNWEEAERHYGPAAQARPDSPRIQAVGHALAYRQAIADEDIEARRAAVQNAEALIETLPDSVILYRVLIDGYMRDSRFDEAFAIIDRAVELEPDTRQLYNIRLRLLAERGEVDGIEAQLRDMITRFPEDTNLEATLVRFFLSQQQPDKAEAYLRERIDPDSGDDEAFIQLVRFVSQLRGPEAALAELDAALAETPDNRVFQALRAGLVYEMGDREGGLAAMEAALDGAEPSDQTNRLKIALAQMLVASNNDVGARRAVEEVLAADPSNVDALKMSARWDIERDDPEKAIQSLRTVLDQEPQDAEAMTLMARAHQRNGSPELARDLLALAVEASNNAPETSVRYANVLLAGNNGRAAEDVLVSSLRLHPDNVQVLLALGQTYLATEEFARAEQVVGTLRRMGTDESISAADGLQVTILARQDRTDETVAFLEQMVQGNESATGAKIAIARAHLASGDTEAAVRSAEESLAEEPDNLALRFAAGAIYAATGDLDAAEREYRTILSANDRAERVWIELIRVMNRKGDRAGALETLNDGLAAIPQAPNLLWAQASLLEQNQDYEGAISVYEDLYAMNSNSPIVANNLASLITTYRDDQASLDRAYAIARRLRGTEVPAFQDTYGWIAYRLGEYEDAIDHLEPAAAGLAGDALVQYHLGRAYLAVGRRDEALAQFRKALEIAGEVDTRPQFADAREQLRQLESEATE